jgi:hypothetical protein
VFTFLTISLLFFHFDVRFFQSACPKHFRGPGFVGLIVSYSFLIHSC